MADKKINCLDHPDGTRMLVARTALLGSNAPEHDITIIAWHSDGESFTSRVNVDGGTIASHTPDDYLFLFVLNADGSRPTDAGEKINPDKHPVGTVVNYSTADNSLTSCGTVVAWDNKDTVWILSLKEKHPACWFAHAVTVFNTLVPTYRDGLGALPHICERAHRERIQKYDHVRADEVTDFLKLCREVKELGKKEGFNVAINLS